MQSGSTVNVHQIHVLKINNNDRDSFKQILRLKINIIINKDTMLLPMDLIIITSSPPSVALHRQHGLILIIREADLF